jgi:hypothetical protein
MDLLEFQRKFQEQYGIIDEDVGKISKAHILTFWKDEEGRILSKLKGGGIVFRHRDGGQQINEGETWVCELLERNTTFFAIGVVRLDAKAFYDLRADQVDHLADVIWEKNSAMLEPRFETRYLETLNKKVEERAAEAKRKAEEETARAESLRKQMEAMEIRHKMELSAVEAALEDARKQAARQEKVHAPPSAEIGGANLHPKVRRIGPDQVQSEDFTSRRYFVHVSVDRNTMTIRPHEKGSVLCADGVLSLAGLGLVSSYNGPTDLPAEYSPAYGGYLVLLKPLG